jgi:Xaa-Pro aminopeptidase
VAEAMLLMGDSDYNANLYYKTHFLAEGLIYLEIDGRGIILTSPMEEGRASKEASVSEIQTMDQYGLRDLMKEFNDRQKAFTQVLVRFIREAGADRVRVDSSFPALRADSLRAEGVEVEIDPELLVMERRQKSPQEIAAIEEAQRANERATARGIDLLRQSEAHGGTLHYNGVPLTAERLRLEVEIALVKEDMDISASPITAPGKQAADPHSLGSGPLCAGEAIVLDVFPRSKKTRYWADMTRTVVKGTPSQELQRMYDTVLRGQEAALAQIRAGANGKDVHRAVEEVFEQAGYAGEGPGPRYIHSTGHGVGLDIHEAPGLGSIDNELLENEVVTVEPGLYDPEIGGIRIEDMVVVTSDGYRNLTHFSKEFEV